MAGRGLPVGRRGSLRLAAAVAALVFVACGGSADGPQGSVRSSGEASVPTTTAPTATSTSPSSTPPPAPAPSATSAPPPLPGVDPEAADPARVEVPAIGVDAPIIALGLDPTGPAVFYRLHELQLGDAVRVTRADGSRVEFTVRRTEQHAKAAFPTEIVYAPTAGAELRLITCGGAFDRSSGHYVDNVIVFATRS